VKIEQGIPDDTRWRNNFYKLIEKGTKQKLTDKEWRELLEYYNLVFRSTIPYTGGITKNVFDGNFRKYNPIEGWPTVNFFNPENGWINNARDIPNPQNQTQLMFDKQTGPNFLGKDYLDKSRHYLPVGDPYGWGKFNAPNKKTGINKIPKNVIDAITASVNAQTNDIEKSDYEDIEVYDDGLKSLPVGSDRIAAADFGNKQSMGLVYNSVTGEYVPAIENETEYSKAYEDQMNAIGYNNLINMQPDLIKKYCNTVDHSEYKHYWEYKESYAYNNCVSRGGSVKIGNDGTRRSNYCTIKEVLEHSAWDHMCPGCLNKESGGVFVQPVTSTRKNLVGFPSSNEQYWCGCISDFTTSKSGCAGGDGYMTMLGTIPKDVMTGYYNAVNRSQYLNSPSFLEKLGDWAVNCSTDYHCVLDIASIIAVYIPIAGWVVSTGLDVINAAAYGIEGLIEEDPEKRAMNYTAAVLTLAGGLMTGVGPTRSLIKSSLANPKVLKMTDDFAIEVTKKFGKNTKKLTTKSDKEALEKIWKEQVKKHGLSDAEILIAGDLFEGLSKIDPDIMSKVAKQLKSFKDLNLKGKLTQGNIMELMKHKGLSATIKVNGGDVAEGIFQFAKTRAGKDFLVQAGMFGAVVYTLSEDNIKWFAEKGYLGPRKMVAVEGYPWEESKDIFMTCNSNQAKSKGFKCDNGESSYDDNILFIDAWIKGKWRPGNPVPPQYQTNTYKKIMKIEKENVDKRTQQLIDNKREGRNDVNNKEHTFIDNGSMVVDSGVINL